MPDDDGLDNADLLTHPRTPIGAAHEGRPMNDRLRVGLVGIDHFHATGWAETVEQFPTELEVVALFDPDPAIGVTRAPRFHDPVLRPTLGPAYERLPFYSDLDTLLAEHSIELAIVCLHNALAPAAVERLSRAGVHVLVDKPTARTAAEARRAFEAARAAGIKVAVGLTNRFSPGWREARRLVESGRLGRLFTTEAIFTTSSVRVRDPANHLFNRSLDGGGILTWLGVHQIDALLWVTGDQIVEVQAMSGQVGGESIDVEDALTAGLRWASGAIGTVSVAYALPRPGYEGYVAFRGQLGSVSVGQGGDLEWFGRGDAGDPVLGWDLRFTEAAAPGYGTGGRAMLADLLAAIREGREPVVGGEAMVRTLEVVDAIYASAASGRRVQVGTQGA